TQAQGVLDMATDPKRCQVVLVAQPEEMPVRETEETIETLSKMGITLGPIVMNGVWPELRSLGKEPEATLRAAARDAGEDLSDDAIRVLSSVATTHARRARNLRTATKPFATDVALPQIELSVPFTARLVLHTADPLALVV